MSKIATFNVTALRDGKPCLGSSRKGFDTYKDALNWAFGELEAHQDHPYVFARLEWEITDTDGMAYAGVTA
jgi:hypothetical protein